MQELIQAIVTGVTAKLKVLKFKQSEPFNFLVNLISGLIAYSCHPKKPSLDLEYKGLASLPPAIF